ncbi:MAG: Fic family protein [Lachnospiraceae bacterium]|jgi:Fic family protein|nr:Fic family protein [Lachnospiraceae bacterium]
MHVFDYSFLKEGVLPAELVNLTSTISALNAISESRRKNNKIVYTELEKIARIQSVKGSNAIEGIITTDARIKEIVDGNSAPLNHTEMEIVGYRNALDEIHTSHEQMIVSEQTILHLHEVMTEVAGYEQAGKYKTDDNIIAEIDEYGRRRVRFAPIPASQTAEAMEQLILAYIDARDNSQINNLLLIPCVILDFLCIHPFADGNGRVSRLLTLLLMYKSGFNIGKYVSFEEQINLSKEYYYGALQDSSIGWHSNENTYTEFMKNFLSTLYKCYKELDKRFSTVNGKKLKKTERIEQTVLNSVLPISKAEICGFLPDVSPTTVEAVLGKMVKNGSVKKLGTARATKYVNAKYIK